MIFNQPLILSYQSQSYQSNHNVFVDFVQVHKVERSFGKVERSIRIPKNADADRVQATLKDGVLSISFPKIEVKQVKSRKISIQWFVQQ